MKQTSTEENKAEKRASQKRIEQYSSEENITGLQEHRRQQNEGEQNRIVTMVWLFEATFCSCCGVEEENQGVCDEMLEQLVRIYGNYDKNFQV